MIRPVKYRDIAAISSIFRVSQPGAREWHSSLVPQAWPSTRGTLFSSVLPARSVHTFVMEEGNQIYGFIQIRPRSSRDKWDVIRLVATVDRPEDVWMRLLEYACVAAGNRGAGKLFANVPEDAEELEIFRRIGFYRFTAEETMTLQIREAGPFPELPASVRPARPADAFPILQLYGATAPRNVQQAEGLTARDWSPPTGRMAGLLYRVGLAQESPQTSWSFIAEENGKIYAWFRLRWRDGRHRLSFLIHPDRRQEFPVLRDFAIDTARAIQPGILAVQVRDYQQELIPSFEEAGFEHDGRYLLLVKHIAVQVMERKLAPVLTRA